MRLIQANIWGGKLEYQLRDFLREQQPDILCMQEVQDLPGASGGIFATLDELEEHCGCPYRHMSPTYTSKYQERQNNYGNAILSKFPLNNTQTIFTQGSYKLDFDLTYDNFNVRNLQRAEIDVNGKSLHIFNHHGWLLQGSKLGNDETLRQMGIILDEINKVDGPVILTGDFNLSPDSDSIKLMSKKLRNLSVEHNLVTTYTQLNIHEIVCDYIFVNDQINVTSFATSKVLVSDHKPLIMEFTL